MPGAARGSRLEAARLLVEALLQPGASRLGVAPAGLGIDQRLAVLPVQAREQLADAGVRRDLDVARQPGERIQAAVEGAVYEL